MRLQPNQWVGKQAFAVSTDGMTECNNFKSTSDFITLLTGRSRISEVMFVFVTAMRVVVIKSVKLVR